MITLPILFNDLPFVREWQHGKVEGKWTRWTVLIFTYFVLVSNKAYRVKFYHWWEDRWCVRPDSYPLTALDRCDLKRVDMISERSRWRRTAHRRNMCKYIAELSMTIADNHLRQKKDRKRKNTSSAYSFIRIFNVHCWVNYLNWWFEHKWKALITVVIDYYTLMSMNNFAWLHADEEQS